MTMEDDSSGKNLPAPTEADAVYGWLKKDFPKLLDDNWFARAAVSAFLGRVGPFMTEWAKKEQTRKLRIVIDELESGGLKLDDERAKSDNQVRATVAVMESASRTNYERKLKMLAFALCQAWKSVEEDDDLEDFNTIVELISRLSRQDIRLIARLRGFWNSKPEGISEGQYNAYEIHGRDYTGDVEVPMSRLESLGIIFRLPPATMDDISSTVKWVPLPLFDKLVHHVEKHLSE